MQRLIVGAEALGLRLLPGQVEAFQVYLEDLVAWNQRFNLTTITDPEQVETRHFLDSLSVLQAEEARKILSSSGARAIDIGSGGGFPGIPLAIVYPQVAMTLVEATGKKVCFLEHVAQRLGLKGVVAIHGRAEDVAHDASHRERYGLALARAVAELPVVLEYALPFCQIGGCLVAQRGQEGDAEARAALKAISLLGGAVLRADPVRVPGMPEGPTLVVIKKTCPTPSRYPRRAGIPSKRPLV
jgi:16S rRNA (guanine527-N7)-methyltransferase